MRTKAGMTV